MKKMLLVFAHGNGSEAAHSLSPAEWSETCRGSLERVPPSGTGFGPPSVAAGAARSPPSLSLL